MVFAQGPIGLCATAGAKLMGASFIIGVDGDPVRMEMARQMGADVVLDPEAVRRRRGSEAPDRRRRRRRDRGARHAGDVRERAALRCGRAARSSSLGVYSGKLQVPYDAFAAGLGDHRIVTTLCPGRQGAHAPADERWCNRGASTRRR